MPDLGYWLAGSIRYTRESTLDWWSWIANTRTIPSKDTLPLSAKNEASYVKIDAR